MVGLKVTKVLCSTKKLYLRRDRKIIYAWRRRVILILLYEKSPLFEEVTCLKKSHQIEIDLIQIMWKVAIDYSTCVFCK